MQLLLGRNSGSTRGPGSRATPPQRHLGRCRRKVSSLRSFPSTLTTHNNSVTLTSAPLSSVCWWRGDEAEASVAIVNSVNGHAAGSATASPTIARDQPSIGSEIVYGTTLIGHVEGVVRDPLTQRVWRVLTSYGPARRQEAVPMAWVLKRSASRLDLAVGTGSLDNLADWPRA
jgi:hypothetical protein